MTPERLARLRRLWASFGVRSEALPTLAGRTWHVADSEHRERVGFAISARQQGRRMVDDTVESVVFEIRAVDGGGFEIWAEGEMIAKN